MWSPPVPGGCGVHWPGPSRDVDALVSQHSNGSMKWPAGGEGGVDEREDRGGSLPADGLGGERRNAPSVEISLTALSEAVSDVLLSFLRVRFQTIR